VTARFIFFVGFLYSFAPLSFPDLPTSSLFAELIFQYLNRRLFFPLLFYFRLYDYPLFTFLTFTFNFLLFLDSRCINSFNIIVLFNAQFIRFIGCNRCRLRKFFFNATPVISIKVLYIFWRYIPNSCSLVVFFSANLFSIFFSSIVVCLETFGESETLSDNV